MSVPAARRVHVACTSCSSKLGLQVKPGDEGKRVTVTCPRCGQQLRVRLPERPKMPQAEIGRLFDDIFQTVGKPPFTR